MEYLLVKTTEDEQVYLNDEPVGTSNTILRIDTGYVFVRVDGSGERKVLVQNTTLKNPKVVAM